VTVICNGEAVARLFRSGMVREACEAGTRRFVGEDDVDDGGAAAAAAVVVDVVEAAADPELDPTTTPSQHLEAGQTQTEF